MTDDRARVDPRERFASPTHHFDLMQELAALRAEPPSAQAGHRQKALFKSVGRTIALFSFDAGAVLPSHSAAGVVSIQVLEGKLEVHASGDTLLLRAGSLLVLAADVPHDVRAIGPAAFVLQVSLATPKA